VKLFEVNLYFFMHNSNVESSY